MTKATMWITVLLSLFIYQSVWNMAAAFCHHEVNTAQNQIQVSGHFGHHLAFHATDELITSVSVEKVDSHQTVKSSENHQHWNDDHTDHLPSFAQIILNELAADIVNPTPYLQDASEKYHWVNFYQSPDLLGQNPPPLLSPL